MKIKIPNEETMTVGEYADSVHQLCDEFKRQQEYIKILQRYTDTQEKLTANLMYCLMNYKKLSRKERKAMTERFKEHLEVLEKS